MFRVGDHDDSSCYRNALSPTRSKPLGPDMADASVQIKVQRQQQPNNRRTRALSSRPTIKPVFSDLHFWQLELYEYL